MRLDLKIKLKTRNCYFDLSPDEDTYNWFITFESTVCVLLQIKYCSVRRYQRCFGEIRNMECYEIETKN